MKKVSLIIVSVMVLAAIFAGCGTSAPSTSAPPAATENASVAPTEAATEAASQAPTEAPAEPVSIKTAGSTSVGPVMEALAEMYNAKYPNVEIDVEAGGSGVGVTSCGDGTVDFGMASRDVKADELTKYPDMKTTVLCKDGIAVVVNSANSVTGLTIDQIKGIFTGEIKDWSEVGGTAGKINMYTRDAASGTREAFQNLMLGKDSAGKQIEIDETLYAGVFDSNGAMGSAVQGDPNGIGYMSLGIVPSYSGAIAVNVDSVKATTENMMNGTYKYVRPFNLLTMGEPEGAVADLFNYLTSDPEAVTYMEDNGYVMP